MALLELRNKCWNKLQKLEDALREREAGETWETTGETEDTWETGDKDQTLKKDYKKLLKIETITDLLTELSDPILKMLKIKALS